MFGFDINYITLIGFLAESLFFCRFAVQLIFSERAKASLSPSLFWQLSLSASLIMMLYGLFRQDFSIIEGQIIAYFIYIRNLQLKKVWKNISKYIRFLLLFIPLSAIFYGILHYEGIILPLFNNPRIPDSWLLWGIVGQTLFASRFIVQWLFSEYKRDSYFPTSFWIISMMGAIIIIIYSIATKDIILLLGKGFGFVVYARNLYLKKLEKRTVQ